MATALRASCPNCKLMVTVSDTSSDSEIATVICKGCGKRFGLRFPKSEGPTSPAPSNNSTPRSRAAIARIATPAADDPFANLGGALPEQIGPTNMNWENYQVRRKPLIAGKPLAIAVGATAVIACVIAIGIFVSKKATEIDMNAIGDSLLKGPADTTEKIHADWQRYDDEQKKLTASISRQSDCAELMFPLERLEEKHLNLLIRGALLDPGSAPATNVKGLPPAPGMQPSEGKTFRAVEAHLTTEFRNAEKKVNQFSNAVLSYLHTQSKPIAKSDDESVNRSLDKTLIKIALCRTLAEAHRGAEESKTAVAIYELTEELKKLKTSNEPSGVEPASTPSTEQHYAEFTANQMQTALAIRFIKDPQSEIAKALAAFDQAY